MNEDFQDLLALFVELGVDFVVVGAHALAVHGAARSTGDLDVMIRANVENAARTHEALRRFGAPLKAHGVEVRDFATPGMVYQLGLPPRRIDVINDISGVSFDEAWATHVVEATDGLRIPYLGRDALIRNKRAAGRPKDLTDIALLEEADHEPPSR